MPASFVRRLFIFAKVKIMKKIIFTGTLLLGLLFINSKALNEVSKTEMKKTSTAKPVHTNHLINENSPYLLSHAHNPVDWYPWGDEALKRAKAEDKPIFLSIGYAACHWCHVMEHESFENEDIAATLNKYFISIKVDREQRPDLDQIYMSFTTAMTGHGGWPMSVFLTPDLKPFYAGTYFPPEDRYGRPGFMNIITQIGQSYKTDRKSIIGSSENIFNKVSNRYGGSVAGTSINKNMITRAAESLSGNVDKTNGGFGSAPKFPHAVELGFLLQQFKHTNDSSLLEAAVISLDAMANGGIYDHLGGGFARYSTDTKWLVPHFEKMLYDNALLVETYADAFLITGNEHYKTVIIETLNFILREMTDASGGFYSALDADSEGEEGKFYVWAKGEINHTLGEDADTFCKYYNVTQRGNFEGKNTLNLTHASYKHKQTQNIEEFERKINEAKKKLMEVRSERIRPLTDDKILTSWNGLALSAFCRGYQITGDEKYLEAAADCAAFIKKELFQNNSLTHAYREGRHSSGQFLEDYAYLVKGLLDLFETDNSSNNFGWLELSAVLADNAIQLFLDETGHFYLRDANQADLIIRPKDETDGAIPSPGSIMIQNLLKLHRLTENKIYLSKAELALSAISGLIVRGPSSMTSAVLALDYYFNDKLEIVIIGDKDNRQPMLEWLYHPSFPSSIISLQACSVCLSPLFK